MFRESDAITRQRPGCCRVPRREEGWESCGGNGNAAKGDCRWMAVSGHWMEVAGPGYRFNDLGHRVISTDEVQLVCGLAAKTGASHFSY
jgi:hypothetical protein